MHRSFDFSFKKSKFHNEALFKGKGLIKRLNEDVHFNAVYESDKKQI